MSVLEIVAAFTLMVISCFFIVAMFADKKQKAKSMELLELQIKRLEKEMPEQSERAIRYSRFS